MSDNEAMSPTMVDEIFTTAIALVSADPENYIPDGPEAAIHQVVLAADGRMVVALISDFLAAVDEVPGSRRRRSALACWQAGEGETIEDPRDLAVLWALNNPTLWTDPRHDLLFDLIWLGTVETVEDIIDDE